MKKCKTREYLRPNRPCFPSRFRETNSYVVVVTNHLGYLAVKLIQCKEKLCLACWTKDCSIERVASEKYISFVNDIKYSFLCSTAMVRHQCASEDSIRSISINDTDEDEKNVQSTSNDQPFTNRNSSMKSSKNSIDDYFLLFYRRTSE